MLMIQRKYFDNNANILIDCRTHLDATKIGLALAHGAQAAGEGAGGRAGGAVHGADLRLDTGGGEGDNR